MASKWVSKKPENSRNDSQRKQRREEIPPASKAAHARQKEAKAPEVETPIKSSSPARKKQPRSNNVARTSTTSSQRGEGPASSKKQTSPSQGGGRNSPSKTAKTTKGSKASRTSKATKSNAKQTVKAAASPQTPACSKQALRKPTRKGVNPPSGRRDEGRLTELETVQPTPLEPNDFLVSEPRRLIEEAVASEPERRPPGKLGSTTGKPEYSDLPEAVLQGMTGNIPAKPFSLPSDGMLETAATAPFVPGIDLRTASSFLTAVKNQNQWTSGELRTAPTCVAFAVLACVEAHEKRIKATGVDPDYSERDLFMSAAGDPQRGMTITEALQHCLEKGVAEEATVQYRLPLEPAPTTSTRRCPLRYFRKLTELNEQIEALHLGPLVAELWVDTGLITNYRGEIYNGPTATPLSHAVAVVGYRHAPSPHWICKNSWGQNWGDRGYFRVACRAIEDFYEIYVRSAKSAKTWLQKQLASMRVDPVFRTDVSNSVLGWSNKVVPVTPRLIQAIREMKCIRDMDWDSFAEFEKEAEKLLGS